MKVISVLDDRRIKSKNILVEFSILEYLDIAKTLLKNNPFQRKRVKSSSTVYSLLRDDLKAGCVIPPLVLAITEENFDFEWITDKQGDTRFEEFLSKNIQHVIILDGLQRTYNIIDADAELATEKDESRNENFYGNKVRCEIYVGIDKIGILYRMLTLNTGQTPMSLRHQIEILYSNYLDAQIDGITLLREIDDLKPERLGEYSFREIIEGFTSYLMRDYLTFDKSDILSNIKSLEKLSTENQSLDIFKEFTSCYHNLQARLAEVCQGWSYNEVDSASSLSGTVYGRDANSIFNKSQSMTGLGSAVGFLKDEGLSNGFEVVIKDIPKIRFNGDINSALMNLLLKMDDIRNNAPKIGNAQRAYFFYFFRELFNKEGDSYLIIDRAIENAFKRYRQNA
jgi:hypothetical protein